MDIIYLSYNLWHSMRQRTHHIAEGLSKYSKVLFVEPPTNFLYYLNNRNSDFTGKITKIGSNDLYVLKAKKTLPFKNYFSFVNKHYQNMLADEIREIISKLNFSDTVLWTTFPTQVSHIGKYSEAFTIYECMDEYSELEVLYNTSMINILEKELLEKVNLVITTAKNLQQNKSKINNNVILSSNAADTNHFNRVVFDDSIKKAEIFENSKPVIGYIGAIREWLDWELINKLVTEKKEWNFLFVGPVQTDVDTIKNCENMRFTGQINYDELLPYLKLMDVTIVPFKLNKLIENTNPIKIYEYLSSGKPVVVTAFNEADIFKDFIKIAANYEEFIKGIEQSLAEKDENIIKRRLAFAKENSWEQRVNDILEKIRRIKAF